MKSPSPKLRSWTGRSSAWYSGWDFKALSSGQKATTAIHVLIDWQEPEKCCSHPNKLLHQSELANSQDGLKNHLRKRPAAISRAWAPNEVSHIHCDNYLDTCALKWTCQHWQFDAWKRLLKRSSQSSRDWLVGVSEPFGEQNVSFAVGFLFKAFSLLGIVGERRRSMHNTAKKKKQRRFVDGYGSKKKSKVASKPSGSKICIMLKASLWPRACI